MFDTKRILYGCDILMFFIGCLSKTCCGLELLRLGSILSSCWGPLVSIWGSSGNSFCNVCVIGLCQICLGFRVPARGPRGRDHWRWECLHGFAFSDIGNQRKDYQPSCTGNIWILLDIAIFLKKAILLIIRLLRGFGMVQNTPTGCGNNLPVLLRSNIFC